MSKKIFALLVSLILSLQMMVFAEDSINWSYENGVLTIWGSGDMTDYQRTDEKPWDKHINDAKKLVIKNGITSVGDWSFAKFDKLETVEFANTISQIGERAFYNCQALDYIKLPNGLKTIENGAFNSCKDVVRITLPKSLEKIGDSAFMNIPDVPVITIPENVGHIGMWAFMGCSSLEQIYFEGAFPEKMGASCLADIDDNYILYYNVLYKEKWAPAVEAYKKHIMSYSPKERIPVYINNKEICFDVDPIIVNGRTLVPMRDVFEELGAVVTWDGENETATGKKGDTTVVVQIGADTIRKNNQIISVDAPARIHINRTLVPVRAVSEAFDAKVYWNETERAVYIEI